MSILNLTILNRMKFLEEKISLLENENLNLKMLVEAVTTATVALPTSTVKAAKEYREPNLNQSSRGQITYRAAASSSAGGLNPDTSLGQPPQPPQLPTGPDYNGDGVVDGADLGIYNALYGQPGFDGAALGGLLAGWSDQAQPPQPPQLPTGPDYNGDGVVDGADLGIFNSYYGQPGFDGAALGALLTAMGQPSSGGGGQTPEPPSTTFSEFARSLRGTSTKDIASLSGSRYVPTYIN